MPTTITKTVKSAGGDYSSLSAGEAGEQRDLTVADEIAAFECYSFSDTTPVTISGWTTDATRYVRIYTPSSERHSGTWSTSKYRLEPSNAEGISIGTEFCRIDGLQIRHTSVAQNDLFCIGVGTVVGGVGTANIQITNLITRHDPTAVFRQMGIWVVDADAVTYIHTWIDYDHPPDDLGFYNSSLIVDGIPATAHVYSATLIASQSGIILGDAGAVVNAKNVYASTANSIGGALAFSPNSGTINQTTCASSDASATGTGLDNIAVDTTTFVNVTSGSEDFHLGPTSPLKDVGTNTSGEAAPLNFTTDIDGFARTGTWDIGADEQGNELKKFLLNRP